MPLLCISVLGLLLLPLSLSCDSKRSPDKLRQDYRAILQTALEEISGSVETFLQNVSCQEMKFKLHNCTSNQVMDIVSTLHNNTCKMKNLRLESTDGLVNLVLDSMQCSCHEKPTVEPSVRLNRRRMATRRRRNGQKKMERKTHKLCKARAILSTMTECYQILNNL